MAKCCTRSAEKAFELAGLVGGQNHDQDGDLILSKEEFEEQDNLEFDDGT